MKKFLVIGNPINHSLSPKLHNYWIKKNNISAIYQKEQLNSENLKNLISQMRDKTITGLNITVPFKVQVIPYLDKLTSSAELTQSVNTISLSNNKVIGHNTDIVGFERAIKNTNYNFGGKKILILGSGGVVPSIIYSLYRMKVLSVTVSNRTAAKAEVLKSFFNFKLVKKNNWNEINTVNWGEIPEFDIIINATSVGLKDNQKLDLDFSKIGKDKLFYDVIYNPKETNFLKIGKNLGNRVENGSKMFIYQAAEAFKIWHNIQPDVDQEVLDLLDD